MRHCTPLGPQQHTRHAWSHWMNGSRHNKNANRQTEAQRFLLLLERRICSAPSLQSFEYSVLITTEASKLKKGIRTSPTIHRQEIKYALFQSLMANYNIKTINALIVLFFQCCSHDFTSNQNVQLISNSRIVYKNVLQKWFSFQCCIRLCDE